MTDSEKEFVTMQEAARLLGIGRMTFYRRVREMNLPVYESPANRRVRLVRRADVEALQTPVPATGVTPKGKESRGK